MMTYLQAVHGGEQVDLPTSYSNSFEKSDFLVRSHLHVVDRIARQFSQKTGGRAEFCDLQQTGRIGLIDAARRYQPQPGVPFSAYAAIRVRGAIVDHLRRDASTCRATQHMGRSIAQAQSRLEQRLARQPENSEIARHVGISPAELESWRGRVYSGQHCSLEEYMEARPDGLADNAKSTEENVLSQDMTRALSIALQKLAPRDAEVLRLYYIEEQGVNEIASRLGVTMGRVSQIKKAATGRLREYLTELLDC